MQKERKKERKSERREESQRDRIKESVECGCQNGEVIRQMTGRGRTAVHPDMERRQDDSHHLVEWVVAKKIKLCFKLL